MDLTQCSKLKKKCNEFLNLPEDWNSYSASKIATVAVTTTLRLIDLLYATGCRAPDLVPTIEGGTSLEWETLNDNVEISIHPDGEITIYHRCCEDEREFEVQIATVTIE
jgi:hypothetical protein